MRRWRLRQINPCCQRRRPHLPTLPVGALEPTVYPGSPVPNGLDTPRERSCCVSGTTAERPIGGTYGCCRVTPPGANHAGPAEGQARCSRTMRRAADWTGCSWSSQQGCWASLSLLAHFGVMRSTRSGATTAVVRGGTWTEDVFIEPRFASSQWLGDSVCANWIDQCTVPAALLRGCARRGASWGGDAKCPSGAAMAASAPMLTTWTFHLRPGLVWSDGAALRCPRRRLHLEALAQPQVRSRLSQWGHWL